MASKIEKVYKYLPVWMQNIGISAFGYTWQKRRFGGVFEEQLKGFKERESYTEQQWKDYQTTELRKFLIHAFETVPFYKEKYSKAGFKAEDFKNFELSDLPKLPYLEKDELRQFGKTTLMSTKKMPDGAYYSSSGSTGTPTSIYLSKVMHQKWSAGFEARIRNWAGLTRRSSRGMIGGRRILPEGQGKPPYYRYNFIEKQIYFSAYHISKQTAENYVEAMRKYGIDYMTGYAASNFILARFLKEQNLSYPLKAVITSSEKLTQEMRDVFKEVYGCKTYDSYSGVEDCGLISECEHGSLHVSPDMGIIEFLDNDGNTAKFGEFAEMVCTGTLNYDQPLIRYRIGDMAIPNNKKCECGRNMPSVDEIVGRVEDIVIGADGREMVRFHGIFIEMPNIVKAQVVQNDYDNFVINIESINPLSEDEKKTISNRMESQLGKIKLLINRLDEIPLGPNGKFKAVISKVKK